MAGMVDAIPRVMILIAGLFLSFGDFGVGAGLKQFAAALRLSEAATAFWCANDTTLLARATTSVQDTGFVLV